MAKNLMVNMADVVAGNEAVAASLSEKERAVMVAVRDNKMATAKSINSATKLGTMPIAGVLVALVRKGFVVTDINRFGTAVALTKDGAEVAEAL